jgi:type II secretory pathway pseudopilin PulG
MIELMVVVVVVGVLATIAIPIYGRYVKNARVSEATGRIGEIITAAKGYALAHPNSNGNPTWPSGSGDIVDLSSSPLFSYSLTGGGTDASANPLTVTATGMTGLKMAGVTVSVTVPNIYSGGSNPSVTGLSGDSGGSGGGIDSGGSGDGGNDGGGHGDGDGHGNGDGNGDGHGGDNGDGHGNGDGNGDGHGNDH